MAVEPVFAGKNPTGDRSSRHDSPLRRSRESYASVHAESRLHISSQPTSRSSSSGYSSTSSSERSPLQERAPIIADTPPRSYQSTENVSSHITESTNQNQNQRKQQRHRPVSPAESMESRSDDGHPWYKRVLDKYGSLELDNKGSVARDHLALERTFLAWLRTSLAFASIGIAITQLFRLNTSFSQSTPPSMSPPSLGTGPNSFNSHAYVEEGQRLRSMGKPLGATFIGVAIVVLVLGFHRFFQGQYWVVRGKFPASRGSVAIIAFIAGALMVSSLVVILAIAPGAVES